ncbi:MAG: hypothetical protein WC155_00770 [Candidatus Cloacimonadales bacterium]
MKRNILLFLFLIIALTLFGSNNYVMDLTCTQPTLNILKANYFDPSLPYSQPILFNLSIQNPSKLSGDSNSELHYSLEVEFFWNNSRLTDTTLEPLNLASVYGKKINLTNRDIITRDDNNYFEVIGKFSFDDIMDGNSQLKDFIMDTGRFPDGEYRIDIRLIAEGNYVGTSKSALFTVRNIQNVRLISPGVPAGSSRIPNQCKPIIYNWTSSGFNNKYVIEIKEFDEIYELDPSNIEYNGRTVAEEDVQSRSVYISDYNYQTNKYYAWRAKVKYIGEETLNLGDTHNQFKTSSYNVFKFSGEATTEVTDVFQEEFQNTLLNLNIAEITALFEQGYFPKDGIELNGKKHYGKDAIDKIRELFSTYDIEVSVE